MMTTKSVADGSPEFDRLEYQEASTWLRQISQMRRQDLSTFTVMQGAAVTIIGDRLLSLSVRDVALALVALFVALIGVNNERRLYGYLDAIRNRAIAIEDTHGLALLTGAKARLGSTRSIVRSHVAFLSYYVALVAGWIVIFLINFR